MKNKKVNIKFIVSSVFILLIVMSNLMVFADVGGIQRYDGTTGSDYSYGADYSYDSDYSFIGDYALMNLIFSPTGMVVIVIAAIALFMWGKKKGIVKDVSDVSKMGEVLNQFKNEMSPGSYANSRSTYNYNENISENVASKVRAVDEAFSEEQFLAEVKEVFIKLQNAWTTRDWKVIRPFESNELFQIHSAQLQEFIDNGKINVVERIAIQRASLKSFVQDGDKETLKVDLDAVMRDYIIDEKTKEILEGDKNKDQYMKYTLTFIRKAGVKTQVGKNNVDTTNCPNCGAPTEITSAGQCEYCGSVITTGEHDWVLSALEGRR